VAEAVQEILQARGVERWIVTEIKEKPKEKFHQESRGRPSANTLYVKETSTRFELEYRIDSVQPAAAGHGGDSPRKRVWTGSSP
jgi:hypothetical protein